MNFETTRLLLRKPKEADAHDLFANYTQDAEVTLYLSWTPHSSLEQTQAWVRICIDDWDQGNTLPFIIYHKAERQAIGMIDFRINGFIARLGYVLAKSYWNQGLMTEAGRPLLEYFLKRDDIYRVDAIHDLANPASGRVLEKLGMDCEGLLRKYAIQPNISSIPRDCKLYSIVKSCVES